MNDIKIGLLVMRRDRPGFDHEWGEKMENRVRDVLGDLPYDVFFPEDNITSDVYLRNAIDKCESEDVNVLIVIQPTMADGKLSPILAQQWEGPIILWATPERDDRVSSNSLVGTHIYMSNMSQSNHPFELVYGMPDSEDTDRQLFKSIRTAYSVTKLRECKIGLIGFHAPGFVDMNPDPYLLKAKLGVVMSHTSIPYFIDIIEGLPKYKVEDDINKLHNLSLPMEGVSSDHLPLASKYYLALREHMTRDNLDGIAIREWSELSSKLGQWPYLAIARLLSQGQVVAMEGDVDGAVSALIGELLGCGPVYISDWLEHTEDTIALWHTGNAPFQLSKSIGRDGGPVVARHFNDEKPAVVDADLKPDIPITVYRLWHCDNQYKLTAFEGRTISPPKNFRGTNGFARFEDVSINFLFRKLCQNGMPHHVSVVEGHHANLFHSVANHTDIDVIDV